MKCFAQRGTTSEEVESGFKLICLTQNLTPLNTSQRSSTCFFVPLCAYLFSLAWNIFFDLCLVNLTPCTGCYRCFTHILLAPIGLVHAIQTSNCQHLQFFCLRAFWSFWHLLSIHTWRARSARKWMPTGEALNWCWWEMIIPLYTGPLIVWRFWPKVHTVSQQSPGRLSSICLQLLTCLIIHFHWLLSFPVSPSHSSTGTSWNYHLKQLLASKSLSQRRFLGEPCSDSSGKFSPFSSEMGCFLLCPLLGVT